MSFTSDSKQQIALKKLIGKAHTKVESEFFNESKTTGLSVSFDKIIGEEISSSPGTDYRNVYNNTVEFVRFVVNPLQESIENNVYHAFELKLPSDYNTTSQNPKKGQGDFVQNKEVYTTNGRLQLIPPSIGGNNYEAKLYNGGNSNPANEAQKGTRIPPLDNSRWYLDYFNGILFQQNPQFSVTSQNVTVALIPGQSYKINNVGSTTNSQWQQLGLLSNVTPAQDVVFIAGNSQPSNVSGFGSGSVYPARNPDYIDAYLYVGKMADKKAGSLSSMWEEISGELVPTGIIDGNTGVFAADFNIDLLDDGEVELFKITTMSTEREDAQDLYFELDVNGDIMPKE